MYKKLQLNKHWNISNTDIYVFETENLLKLETEKNIITQKYKEGLSRITSTKKRQEFIATRIAHHFVFNHSEEISYQNSAPFFSKNYSISVSHTKQFIAIAYSKSHRIGIDLELGNTRIERIEHKILHADENAYKNTLSELQRYDYLNKIWTTKEACYKACHSNCYSFKQYYTKNILSEKPSCEIIETKENFKLYFKRLEKLYFCLAILS